MTGTETLVRVDVQLTACPQALPRVVNEFSRRGLRVYEMDLETDEDGRHLRVITEGDDEDLRRLRGALAGSTGVEEGPFLERDGRKGWSVSADDVSALEGRTVAVVGYGSQGRAQARNLRDAGVEVVVGARRGGASWQRAESDGQTVREIPEAVHRGDVVLMLVPDEVQPEVFRTKVEDNLEPGDAVVFAHGFTVWSGRIDPPKRIDVGLVAPKSPGAKVRSAFVNGPGVPVLVAVDQDASGEAWPVVVGLAHGIGATPGQVIETTFEEETETDLFGEQAVLCGGLTELMEQGFDTLVEAGYRPEVAYFEVVNEMKLIVDLIHDGGVEQMWSNVSNTAEYGGRTRGPEVIDGTVCERMETVLADIQSGVFADEWIEEQRTDEGRLPRLRSNGKETLIEDVGNEFRETVAVDEERGHRR